MKSGDKLGPYEILAPLGAGGMGEVYRARDTKLERDVAIKVLPDAVSQNPERLARFEREAKVLASLNHPNIAQIYGVEDRAIVMELVEGDEIKGPLPLETALTYAKQIADAMEAAHEKGIVHRDLKPANVKVTPQGVVKVLDFGLAAVAQKSVSPETGATQSPTLTLGATQMGVLLGTAAYMSPEQAAGLQVDRRADIWSFGVVLYEMLTGKRLFIGDTIAHTLADVLRAEIPFGQIAAPEPIRALLRRCLDRDVKSRLRDIGEARITIARYIANPASAADVPPSHKARAAWLPWTLSVVLFLAFLGLLVWQLKPSAAPIITRFSILLGAGQQFSGNNRLSIVLSPDGTHILYAANGRLYLRSMGELEARVIPGTETTGGFTQNPVFSPDGRSVAFWAPVDQALKRVAITGGTPVTICQAVDPVGVSWGKTGIVYARGLNIMRVSPNGGKPDIIVTAKEGQFITRPQMLPGDEVVLFTLGMGTTGANANWDKAQIVVQNIKTGVRKVLHEGSDARYLPTGQIVYALAGTLFALPFDQRRLEVSGGPLPLVEGVMRTQTGVAEYSFSDTGSLIFVPGPASGLGAGQSYLALIDRKGLVETLKLPPASYAYPRISHDGKRVAYENDEGKESAIWTAEVSGAHAPNRLTLAGTGANRFPIWSPDGERIAFQSDRDGDLGIYWQRSDGTGTAERLTKPEKGTSHIPDSWSRDGQTLSFTASKGDNNDALWTYSFRYRKATLFNAVPLSRLGRSVFSPDGRWLAYQVTDTQATHIYVQTYPATATRFQISKEGTFNRHPLWSPDGKELFYIAGAPLMTVSVTTQPGFTFSNPMPLARPFIPLGIGNVRNYDILPDGQHFIGVVLGGGAQTGPAAPQIQVVLNWFEDVKQRVAGR